MSVFRCTRCAPQCWSNESSRRSACLIVFKVTKVDRACRRTNGFESSVFSWEMIFTWKINEVSLIFFQIRFLSTTIFAANAGTVVKRNFLTARNSIHCRTDSHSNGQSSVQKVGQRSVLRFLDRYHPGPEIAQTQPTGNRAIIVSFKPEYELVATAPHCPGNGSTTARR